jgi:hypothetical protein
LYLSLIDILLRIKELLYGLLDTGIENKEVCSMKKLTIYYMSCFLSVILFMQADHSYSSFGHEKLTDSLLEVDIDAVSGGAAHAVIDSVRLPRLVFNATSKIASLSSPQNEYLLLAEEFNARHFSVHSLRKDSIRILSIDGGGIRGILPLMFLVALEERTGKRAYELFDVLAGTSTGGMVALALSIGVPAQDVLNLYLQQGKKIFKRNWTCGPKYCSQNRRDLFRKFFGSKRLSDSLLPTIVTAFSIDRDKPYHLYSKWPQTHIFRHEHLDMLMSDAALATSAAPTFFEPEIIYPLRVDGLRSHDSYAFIDGGVFANNPSMIAFDYAMTLYPHLNYTNIDFLSLGTGQTEQLINGNKARNWNIFRWVKPLLHIVLSANSKSVDGDLKLLLNEKYNRVSTKLSYADSHMDKIGKNIINLQKYGKAMIEEHEMILRKWADQTNPDGGVMVNPTEQESLMNNTDGTPRDGSRGLFESSGS